MAKITVTEIRAILGGNVKTDQDTVIAEKIAFAYGYLDKFIGYNPDAETFNAYSEQDSDFHFVLSPNTRDIVLSNVICDGVTVDISADLEKVRYNEWTVTNTDYEEAGASVYAEFKSANLTARLRSILTELIVYEIKKLPAFDNTINKVQSNVGPEMNSYVFEKQFYADIDSKFSECFQRRAL